MNWQAMKKKRWFGVLCAAATLGVATATAVGCGSDDPQAADTVFANGYVYTVDANDSVKQAVAVREGVIVYVGTDEGAARYIGSGTKVINLGGRMLMPGFVDGHMHPISAGRAQLLCNLNYASLTRAELQTALQACLDRGADKEPDGWLQVVNWNRQGTQSVDADPDKSVLDALNTRRPIVVTSSDFHTVWTNSRGLALAHVTRDTPNPPGGSFARDGQGNPTGMCEDAAGFVISSLVPADSDADRVEQARAALQAMAQQGVTTFMDAAAGPDQGRAFTTLQRAGDLTARGFFAMLINAEDLQGAATPAEGAASAVAAVKALAAQWDQGEPKVTPTVHFRNVKIFGDGVVNAPADTGGLLTPYFTNAGTDVAPNWVVGSNTGANYFPPEVLNPLMAEIARNGLDPHVHATGDRTVRQVLDAVEYARAQVPGTSFRPSIAHNEVVDPADYPRFQALDVTATFSFQWAQQAPYSVGETEAHLGPERFARMEPFGSLRNAGARVAYGSDWPIDPLDELLALKIGVTRSGDPTNPASYGPALAGRINADPALSRADALRAITMSAAYQLRMDHRIGSIERGKFADLIVLEQNFMEVPEDNLARNQVLLTMVGGKVVMAKAPFASVGAASAMVSPLRLRASTGHTLLPAALRSPHGDGHNH